MDVAVVLLRVDDREGKGKGRDSVSSEAVFCGRNHGWSYGRKMQRERCFFYVLGMFVLEMFNVSLFVRTVR